MKIFSVFILILCLAFTASTVYYLVIDRNNLQYVDENGIVQDSVIYFDEYKNPQTAGNAVFGKTLTYINFLNSVLSEVISSDSAAHPLVKQWYASVVADSRYSILDSALLTPFSKTVYDAYITCLHSGYWPYNIDLLKSRFGSWSDKFDELRLLLREERTSYIDGLGTLTFEIEGISRTFIVDSSSLLIHGVYFHDFDSSDVELVHYGAFMAYAPRVDGAGSQLPDVFCYAVDGVQDSLGYCLGTPNSSLAYDYFLNLHAGFNVSVHSSITISCEAVLSDYVGYLYSDLPLVEYSVTFYPVS